jgi:hypothetical protein
LMRGVGGEGIRGASVPSPHPISQPQSY